MKYFFFFSILHKLYCEVAKELRRRDPAAEFSGLLYGRDQLRDLQEKDFPSQELCVFSEELRGNLPNVRGALDLLVRWERRQGVSFSTILSTDRRFHKFPREEGLRIGAITVGLCEAWLDRFRPDAVVAEGIDDLVSHILYYAARDRGIPYLITYASPTPYRFAIYSNPENRWEKLVEIFSKFREGPINADRRARARALVQEYRERHLVPTYLGAGYNRMFSGRELSSLGSLLRQQRLDPAYRLNPSFGGGVTANVALKCERVLRAGISARRYFQRIEPEEPFVFFPLQMEPECSTLVFAPFHANQLNVIECLSKSLPIDHLLYVKEHPVMVGRRPVSQYRAIHSLPNVRLIRAGESSHELIQQARAVVTITSSVGWEALIHGKPVIVLGNVWYGDCDLVHRLKALADLPGALRRAIFASEPDEELLLKFAAASFEGTYPGQIEHPDYTPGVLSPENIAAVANGIHEHLAWLRTAPARGGDQADAVAHMLLKPQTRVVAEPSAQANFL